QKTQTSAKVTKPAKKKQPATTSKAKGLNLLSEVALSEAKQMNLATKRSNDEDNDKVNVSGDNDDQYDADNEDDNDQDDADNEDVDDQDDADNKDDDGQEDDDE
ncbi:hypothetical protein Tco_0341761, partial [Tanacetum coccineum]